MDAVNDPMMGAIADRTQTRQGKYRPYLLWLMLFLAASRVAYFCKLWLLDSPGTKLAYAYVTFILFVKWVYNAINVPYSAMMGVISPAAEDRQELGRFRFQVPWWRFPDFSQCSPLGRIFRAGR